MSGMKTQMLRWSGSKGDKTKRKANTEMAEYVDLKKVNPRVIVAQDRVKVEN